MLDAIGKPKGTFDQYRPEIQELRERVAILLKADSIEAVNNGDVTTPLRAGLMAAWARATGDPASAIMHWLTQGAPAGIERQIPDLGVFPTKEGDPTCTLQEAMGEQEADQGNYHSLEHDPDEEEIMQDIINPSKGWVKTFTDEDAMVKFLGVPQFCRNWGLW